MKDPKIYTMSETYASYTADDYIIQQGDVGPYFDVVPLHDYLALRTKLTELKAKLEVAVDALKKIRLNKTDECDIYTMGCECDEVAEDAMLKIGEE